MWVQSVVGAFSIVSKPWDDHRGTLTVRARVESDLNELRSKYLPELSPTAFDRHADYWYRGTAPREAVMRAVADMVGDLRYPDFKQEVQKVQGDERAVVYGAIWSALRRLQRPRGELPARDIPVMYASIGNRPDILTDDDEQPPFSEPP